MQDSNNSLRLSNSSIEKPDPSKNIDPKLASPNKAARFKDMKSKSNPKLLDVLHSVITEESSQQESSYRNIEVNPLDREKRFS